MDSSTKNKDNNELPTWFLPLLPFISTILGGTALWYTWFKYSDKMQRSNFYWYDWIRPVLLIIMGILFLVATILFILDKSSASFICQLGFSMIPIILFSNLIIFLCKIIGKAFDHLMQGNGIPSFNISYPSPIDKIILIVLAVIIMWKIFSSVTKNKNSN